MPLSAYFTDDDADAITMSASYSLNGGAAISIPGGIFALLNPLTIVATSVGLADVGTYTISVSVSDSLSPVTTSYTMTVTNASPRLVSNPPAVTAPLNVLTQMDLSSFYIDDDGYQITLTATY